MQKKRNVQPIKQIDMKGVVKKKGKFSLMFLCALLAFAAQAQALLITQPTGLPPSASGLVLWGDDTSQNDINTAIASTIAPAVELYKRNVGQTDEGTLAGSYDTVYPTTEPSGATITHTGGDFVGDPAFLLVKDGNQSNSPLFAWYLFDLTFLGWNGEETIVLSDFWPEQGAISHVALYGTLEEGGQPIPEPVSMLLFGTGLVGILARAGALHSFESAQGRCRPRY